MKLTTSPLVALNLNEKSDLFIYPDALMDFIDPKMGKLDCC